MSPAQPAIAEPVKVYAAASLAEAVERLAEAADRPVVGVHAGTATLVRQIEQGAPADVVISANPRWTDYLAAEGLTDPATHVIVAANRLVLIAPAGETVDGAPEALLSEPDLRIAIAEPNTVPAGVYAAEALRNMGLWEEVRGQLVTGASVRDALAWVARGEADFGLVYATDAQIENRVQVMAEIDPALHAPILYVAAAIKPVNAGAKAFLASLTSAQGRAVFDELGFRRPAP